MKKKLATLILAAMMACMSGCTSASPSSEPSSDKPSEESKESEVVASQEESSDNEADSQAVDTSEPITLRFMMRGDTPQGGAEVMEELNKRAQEEINTTVELVWIPFADQKTKLQLALASQEDWAAFFDAPFVNYNDALSKGLYANLDEYFLNDSFPGLKAAFPEDVVANSKDRGHMYSIPLMNGYGVVNYVSIRKDLREKYGMDPITSFDELESYFDRVLQEEQGTVFPTTYGANSVVELVHIDAPWTFAHPETVSYNLNLGMQGISTPVLISEDGKTALQIYFPGDTPDKYDQFPEDVVEHFIAPEQLVKSWYDKGYIRRDAMSVPDITADIKAGKFAAGFGANNSNPAVNDPNSPVQWEYANIGTYKDLQPGTMATTYKSNNLNCIPVYNSKEKIDRTMLFYDWMFGNKDVHDLIELGIEGKHWTPVGDDRYTIPEAAAANPYFFPPYRFTLNTKLTRILDGKEDIYYDVENFQRDINSFYLDPLKGFTPDLSVISTELAKVVPVFMDEGKPIRFGMAGDPQAAYEELNKKAVTLGLDVIREELLKQITEYLTNYEG